MSKYKGFEIRQDKEDATWSGFNSSGARINPPSLNESGAKRAIDDYLKQQEEAEVRTDERG